MDKKSFISSFWTCNNKQLDVGYRVYRSIGGVKYRKIEKMDFIKYLKDCLGFCLELQRGQVRYIKKEKRKGRKKK